ncbi:class I adenylate-forming enzyme family protein [Rhodococcus qingshengii]|uniref:class I adenylate-forming enzyme family protein n=1 Tax=Rhodococcus qingshengii TaxID=334542 RepID=UPI0036DDF41B
MDVRSILRRSALYNGDRIAVVASGRRITFTESWDRAVRLANALRAVGLTPGDKVAVLEKNSLAAIDFYVGAAVAGICRVPLYARNRTESHVQMLTNAEAVAVIVDKEFLHELDGVLDAVPSLQQIIVRDESYEDWLAEHSSVDPDVDIAPDDLFVIRYTGGTTGQPKGVPFSHEKWWRGARDWFYLFPAPVSGDAVLHIGPISHAAGYTLLPVWAAGGTQVVVDGLSADELIEVFESERIAYTFMPPTLLNRLTRVLGAKDRDLSALKVLFVGASPISEETTQRARDVFGDEKLWQLLGGTEACPTAGMGAADWFADVPGSEPLLAAGRLFPWAELEVRDEEGREVPTGEVGDIWVRSDTSATEFYNAPEETAERIRDGWVSVGDVGRIDTNGYVYLIDRKNDMIVSGGFNIYPGELENVIASHPDVLEVAVFAVPNATWGESPMAVCMVAEGANVTEDEIITLVSDRLGSYKKPVHVQFQTEPLPRSPVGKLMRRTLREPHWDGHARRISAT